MKHAGQANVRVGVLGEPGAVDVLDEAGPVTAWRPPVASSSRRVVPARVQRELEPAVLDAVGGGAERGNTLAGDETGC